MEAVGERLKDAIGDEPAESFLPRSNGIPAAKNLDVIAYSIQSQGVALWAETSGCRMSIIASRRQREKFRVLKV